MGAISHTSSASQPVQAGRDAAEAQAKPGTRFAAEAPRVSYRERFSPREASLLFLSCGEFDVPPGAESRAWSFPGEESLLFMWQGRAEVLLGGRVYELAPYDTLYIPRDASFRLRNANASAARLVHCAAPATNAHPAFHSRFSEFSRQEARIRRLKGKDVYMMFDVSEGADKLVAGYTFFQPRQRSWPAHNHTDQEEVYFFIKGTGAMEVYDAPENLSFVHTVREGDAVTIPFLNYHPVFSQDSPLEFIWCIAGERYWVGDKKKEFMTGGAGPITT
ncbi:MAG: cupin domain-containing protein [Terriglobia bacterium]